MARWSRGEVRSCRENCDGDVVDQAQARRRRSPTVMLWLLLLLSFLFSSPTPPSSLDLAAADGEKKG